MSVFGFWKSKEVILPWYMVWFNNIWNRYDRILIPIANWLSPVLPAIPNHIHDLVFWSAFFFFLSAIVRAFIAPTLLNIADARGIRVGENARKKWGHYIVSFVHSIVATFWSVYFLATGKHKQAVTVEDRVLGYDPNVGNLFAFVAGYFIWDLAISCRNIKTYGRGFAIHAILGFISIIVAFRPYLMYVTLRFLLFEVSTIFLDLHWFMEKLGMPRNHPIMLANDLLCLLAYMCIRLVWGSYYSYITFMDTVKIWRKIPPLLLLVSTMAILTTNTLNFYWFYKLSKSTIMALLSKIRNKVQAASKKRN